MLVAPTASRTEPGWSSALKAMPQPGSTEHINLIRQYAHPLPCSLASPFWKPSTLKSWQSMLDWINRLSEIGHILGYLVFLHSDSWKLPKPWEYYGHFSSHSITRQRISSMLTAKWQKLKNWMCDGPWPNWLCKEPHCKFSLKCQRTIRNSLFHCFTCCHKGAQGIQKATVKFLFLFWFPIIFTIGITHFIPQHN